MKLVYCWINNYLGFNDQGFNLGSKYIYAHTFVEKENKLTLTRIQNEHYIDGYFIKDNDKGFENVTAIVGENGSGKSLIMRLLARIVGNDKLLIAPNFYVLFFENISGEIEYMIWEEYIDKDSFPISAQPRGKYPIPTQIFLFEKQIKNLRFTENIFSIYYIPILGFEKYPFAANRFTDVSTQAVFKADELAHSHEKNITLLDLHKSKEVERLLTCLNYFKQIDVKTIHNKFQLPEKVILSWDLEGSESIIISDVTELNENDNIEYFIKKVEDLFQQEEKELRTKNDLVSNQQYAFNSLIIIWLRDIIKGILGELEYFAKFRIPKQNFKFNDSDKFEEFVSQNLPVLAKSNIINWRKITDEWDNIISKLGDHIKHSSYKVNDILKNELDISFENGIDLLYYISPFSTAFAFLKFKFRNISSGEQALLNLYSRLYYSKLHINQNQFYNQNIKNGVHLFLFIDEGELGFHVKWQQSYISILIEAVSIIFQDQSNVSVQLIFATHSPIVLSDIPNYNVVFLEDKVIVEKQDKSKNLPSTFAANIHDILKHSFFMDTSFLGDYVKQSIDEAIFFLKYTIIEKGNPDERGKNLEELVKSTKNLNID